MEKIKVVIIDDNEEQVDQLTKVVMEDRDFLLVGKAYNGEQACRIIRERRPDIVILDIVMPQGDGLYVMDTISKDQSLQKQPAFLIVSAVGKDEVIHDAFELGAQYYVRKPVDPIIIMGKMRHLFFRNLPLVPEKSPGARQILRQSSFGGRDILREDSPIYISGNPELDITEILMELGVPSHIKGYSYLRKAVLIAVRDPRTLEFVSRNIYSQIADQYDTTPQRVERAIRHAIEVSWNRGRLELIDKLFGYSVNTRKGKPTNAEFIAILTDKISLEYKINLPKE